MQLTLIPNEQTPAVPDMDTSWVLDKNNTKILYRFIHFMTTMPTAVGMAANQIAVVGKLDQERIMLPFFLTKARTGNWEVVCNPKITKHHGESHEEVEICLTWADRKVLAQRYKSIDAEWYTLTYEGVERKTGTLTGFEAQVFQHEYDHLMGIPEIIVPWDYMTVKNDGPKVGNNDPCTCGSGKKFKRCCRS